MNSPFEIGDTVKVLGVKGLSRASAKIINIHEGITNGIELSEAVSGFRFWSHDDLVLFPSHPTQPVVDASQTVVKAENGLPCQEW